MENGRRILGGDAIDFSVEEGVMRGRRGDEDIESFWN